MDHSAYFHYLRSRSPAGRLYRRFYLYPRLCRHLAGHVLDIGCGLGDMLAFRSDTVGADINPYTVAWCRDHGLTARLIRDGQLPFGDAAFDGAILDNVLEHIADPSDLLAETRRVLRPRGHLIVGVPGKRGFEADEDHKVFYDETRLRRTLRRAGFSSTRVFHMPFHFPRLDARIRQYCIYGVFQRL